MFVDIEKLADDLANLTLSEAAELSRYIETFDGFGPAGCLVEVGPRGDGGGAAVEFERVCDA